MPRITLDLLRRRAEHNDGILSNLEEITLHQQDLERIEVVGEVCRELRILYLQNNLIPRIEGLHHLKKLWYLNLAINNIQVIENLEGCEALEKLDLTLNFIADVTCVRRLRRNVHLKHLYLTGNPCTDFEGYRAYVIEQLPQLLTLDGEDVKRSEAIRAHQEAEPMSDVFGQKAQEIAQERRNKEERLRRGEVDPPKYNEKGERLYGNSPEDRMACFKDTQAKIDAAKNPPKDPNSISAAWEEAEKIRKPQRLTPQQEIEKYGRVLQKNEAKLPYKLWEDEKNVYLRVEPGKFIATSSINVDIQPEYARVEVKGKVLQMLLPSEVAPARSSVQRGSAKGELLLTMPIVGEFKGVTDLRIPKKEAERTAPPQEPSARQPPSRDALLEIERRQQEKEEQRKKEEVVGSESRVAAHCCSGIEELD